MIDAFSPAKPRRAALRPVGDAVPVDRAKVARLRRAIVDGTYRIDPAAIAAAMIDADLPPQPDATEPIRLA